MHPTNQKNAAPSWEDIKNSIKGGWEKAKGAVPQGATDFINNHQDLTRGMAGAAIGGGLYGLTANRRSYENEDEFKGRRLRGALQTAVLTGGLAAAYGPTKEFVTSTGRFSPEEAAKDGGIPGLQGMRDELNKKLRTSDLQNNPGFGSHGKQIAQAEGLNIDDIPMGGTAESDKPMWMQGAEMGQTGVTYTGGAAGAVAGYKGSRALDRKFFGSDVLTEAQKVERGALGDKISKGTSWNRPDLKITPQAPGIPPTTPLGHIRQAVPNVSGHALPYRTLTPEAATAKIERGRLIRGDIAGGLGRTAFRGTGTIGGAIGGSMLGNYLGDKIKRQIAKSQGYNYDWVDPSSSALGTP